MSTVDADAVIEVSDEGVTVEKRFAPDEFPVPAIRFEFTSEHDEPVAVRLSEDIPEEFPMDGVGFHPDYHSDQWTAYQDNHVEFVGTVQPDESLVTVYGVRIEDPEEASQFLSEPEIVDVETDPDDVEGSDEDAVDDSSIDDIVDDGGAVKDMLSGESDSVPGLDEEDDDDEDLDLDLDTDDEDVDLDLDLDEDDDDEDLDLDLDEDEEDDDEEDLDLDDDEDDDEDLDIDLDDDDDEDDDEDVELEMDEEDIEDEESADDADEAASTPSRTTQTPRAAPEQPVGERLAEEIRSGRLADEDLEVLRDELEIEAPGADLAKVEHLQSRVEEIAAYAEALEEFLEEEGTGTQLIAEFREELEKFENRLEEAEEAVDGVAASVDEVETTATEQLETLSGELESVSDDVDDVEGEVEDLAGDVEDLEADLEDIGEEVEDIVSWRSELGSMFQN